MIEEKQRGKHQMYEDEPISDRPWHKLRLLTNHQKHLIDRLYFNRWETVIQSEDSPYICSDLMAFEEGLDIEVSQ